MTSMLKIAALSAATLLAGLTAASADESGAGAPLVTFPHYESDAAKSTEQRQQASGYFATAGAPLVTFSVHAQDAATTIEKQRNSGYFPEADSRLN